MTFWNGVGTSPGSPGSQTLANGPSRRDFRVAPRRFPGPPLLVAVRLFAIRRSPRSVALPAFWIVAFAIAGLPAWAQNATIRGFVTAASNGEPLLGVNVVVDNGRSDLLGATTDGDGVYSISVPPGSYRIRATYIGFESYVDSIQVEAGRTLIRNIALELATEDLGEVVVEADQEGTGNRVTAGLQQIRPSDINRIPTPDVSGDLVTFLTTLPGVVTMGDRGGQLYVRGGEPSENLVLLDGMYVHQPFHVLGFYSAFPSDIIQRADFYAAGYGSAFAGRTSSVLDIYSRNGNKRRYEGSVSVAPFVSGLQLEGPLVRDKMSVIVSGRQSVIEQGAQQYLNADLPFHFGDLFGKVHYAISANHQIAITGLHTYDRGTIGESSEDRVFDEVRWSNDAVGVRYIVLPKSVPFVAEVLMSFSRLRTELGPENAPVRKSEFDGFSYAVNMTNYIGNVEWRWGLSWRAPEIQSELGGVFQNVEFGFGRRHKASLFVEPNWVLDNGLNIRLGLVGSLFPGQSDARFIEPRLRILYDRGVHQLSAGAGMYHQEVFGLHDRRDAANVFTAWRSAPTDRLSKATHALVGYRFAPRPSFEIAAEAYYKYLPNIYISEWTAFPRFSSRLQLATGRASGLDLRAEWRKPKFYLYLNYGLSFVRYAAKQSSLQLWYGVEKLDFRPPHDRRHQINAVANARLGAFDVSLRWNFGSGRPYNRVYGFDGFLLLRGMDDLFVQPDEQRVIYERPFEGLLPTYHRLDMSVDRTFDLGAVDLTVQASVINIYDRRNLFALDVFTGRRADQLPILPTLGVKASF